MPASQTGLARSVKTPIDVPFEVGRAASLLFLSSYGKDGSVDC
jgi:hypothetical protein